MRATLLRRTLLALGPLLLAMACAELGARRGPSVPAHESALFRVAPSALPRPLTFVVYGDMRFTDPAETGASDPGARRALIAAVAREHPAAVFLGGDLPWHGGSRADYAVYQQETRAWREQSVRIYPVLGNHEFAGCAEAECLEHWWSAFPQLRGRRWYAVALGPAVRALALDSNASLLEDSAQRAWLAGEFSRLPREVRVVLVWLHHPPVADPGSAPGATALPRANERALAGYLADVARHSRARFVVVAGHLHNYERFEQDGITYLVSGGGGAHPYPVERSAADRYQAPDFPNFHYLRFRLAEDRLIGEMVRLADPGSAEPGRFEVRDRIEIPIAPAG